MRMKTYILSTINLKTFNDIGDLQYSGSVFVLMFVTSDLFFY